MLKVLTVAVLSAFAGAGATIQAMSSSVAVADQCRLYGYTHCERIGSAEMPSTSDPKLRAEMTRHVKQMIRDRSRG